MANNEERKITDMSGAYDYCTLLSQAHSKGLRGITVDVIQFPTKTNDMLAVCRATITFDDGRIFSDIARCRSEIG